ncbi:MAG: transposase domain-containing protein [Desulfovibrio sp.]|nr:transposase domain-containing protein [Desulfovibrio sp.]
MAYKYLWQTLENIPSATTDEDYEALMPWKQ